MSAPRVVCLVAAALLALSLLPATVSAQPVNLRFGYVAGRGDRVRVVAERSTVILSVRRSESRRHRGAESAYVARGTVGQDHLAAHFGELGRLAMRFRPTTKWRPVRGVGGCLAGHSIVRRRGVFSGRLRFRGEGGYLTTTRHRVSGEEISVRSPCVPSAMSSGADETLPPLPQTVTPLQPTRGPAMRLFVGYRSGPLARRFEAIRRPGHATLYVAEEENVVEKLGTYRVAYALASRSAFTADARLSTARLNGAEPFRGTAVLSRGPNGQRSWSGTLAVSFLGDPDVGLTGTQYKTRLSRGF